MTALIILVILFSFSRGIHEGVANIKLGDVNYLLGREEGLRSHKWHKKYYHKINVLPSLFAMLVGIQLYKYSIDYLLLMGLLLLAWSFFEIGYNTARCGSPLMRITEQGHQDQFYEYINFFDIVRLKLWGRMVIVMHVFRIIAGTAFLVLAAAI